MAVSKFGLLNNNSPATALDNSQAQDLLNVDVTPGGLSVKKRFGYGVYKALATGQAMHGGFHAFDSSGNDYQLWGSSTSLYSIVQDATPTQLISSATLNSTWDCTDTQGNSYCVDSSRDLYLRTNGTTKTWFTTPLGTMVESTPDRVIVAGVSASPNTLFVSQSNTFTNFTTGVAATDPFNEVIASPGSHITHIRWGCAKLLWWKDASFGYFDFDDQFSAQVKTVSDVIGTLDNTSAIDPGGRVWFRGQDGHTWMYDCSALTKQSIDITPNVQASGKRTANSWTQSSQSEFASGAVQFNGPSVAVSTTILSGSVVPSSITITDTSSVDFGSYTSVGVGIDTYTVSGAVTLKAYLADSFSNFNHWTGETCSAGSCGCTMSASGGSMSCSSCGAGCSAVSTTTVNNDFVIQYRLTGTGSSEQNIAALNNSAQGYGISSFTNGTSVGVRRYSNWFNRASGSTALFSGSVATVSGDILTLMRDSSTNVLSLYKNGVLLSSATDSTYTSFTNIRVFLGSGYSVTDVYDTARTGNFNSRALDTLFTNPVWGQLSAGSSGIGTYAFSIRTSSNSANAYGADVAITTGTQITNTAKRYAIYSATITATALATSLPQLTDVAIVAASSGSYYSAVRNAPNLTVWSTLAPTQILNDGTETYYIRASTVQFSVLSTTPTWTVQAVGGLITASTGTYFQLRDDFGITNATQTPTLNDFTVNWFEGSSSDQAYMLYFDNAIWQSVAYGAGQAINNYIFKYDLINDGWTLYNFGAGGLLSTAQTLYFGDTAAGNVYNFGTTTADNGTAINSYWRSKAFTGQDPFLQNSLTNIDTFAKKNQGTTLTGSYTVENSTTTTYSVSLSTGNAAFIQSRKLLPSGVLGYTFDMKYGDTSASSAWELLGFRIGFTQQPYRSAN